MLVISGLDRPMRDANSSWVTSNSSGNCWYAAASSKGFSCTRWMFSSKASRSRLSSPVSRTIAGMVARPAPWAARQRRSPITIWYRADDDGLQEPELTNGVHQLGQRLFVEHLARLPRVALDVARRDLAVDRAHRGGILRRAPDQHIGRRVPHPRAQRRRTGVALRRTGGDQRSQAPA